MFQAHRKKPDAPALTLESLQCAPGALRHAQRSADVSCGRARRRVNATLQQHGAVDEANQARTSAHAHAGCACAATRFTR